MVSHYLAVLRDPDAPERVRAVSDALRVQGLDALASIGNLMLFGTADLPRMTLEDGGMLLGPLFDGHGNPISADARVLDSPDPVETRSRIIRECWGAYLLIQREADCVVITRSPAAAGGLACVHAIRQNGGFITSSLSIALRAGLHRKSVDWSVVAHRLAYPGIKTTDSALDGVSELLPGCTLRIGREVSMEQAWSPWDFTGPERRFDDPGSAADAIRGAVGRAVRATARNDRSILLELSGGLDSSIVAASLVGTPTAVTCFNLSTVVPGVDEQHYAGLMAERLGVPLHVETLDLDRMRIHFPVLEDALVPGMGPLQCAINDVMTSAADRHGATSFYSGGGGDSVFSYLRTAAPASDAFAAAGLRAGLTAVGDLARLHQCTTWKAGRLAIAKLFRPPNAPWPAPAALLAPGVASVPPRMHPWFDAPSSALRGDCERVFDLSGNQLFQSQVARASTRDYRFPLLSQPVMEACLRTPTWMWIAGGRNRSVARAAFADLLPRDVLQRTSKATYMGYLGAAFRRNRAEIREALLGGRLAQRGMLDLPAIDSLLAADRPPRDHGFLRAFELCMVENWVSQQP